MAKVLVVDDDDLFGLALASLVASLGHQSDTALTLKDARKKGLTGAYEVVLLDVFLPDGNGLDLIPEIRTWTGEPEVIIVTGAGDADGAELAMKNGAWDYLEKSASRQEIAFHLTRAIRYKQEKGAPTARVVLDREGIVGSSPQLKACLDQVAQAAASEANVLITGPSGTGKELFGSAIHKNSRRAEQPLVVVDCASLPESLVEGILFGHARGAFTGADRAKTGLIGHADGGTLLLDEVGELPLSVQKSFLRVLQERRFRPLGSNQEMASDFRLIAATNKDLETMVSQDRFRSDLLFRLRAIAIELPPLRERAQDIGELAFYHINRLCQRYRRGTTGFSPEFLDALQAYSWPGNVRELVTAMERGLAAAGPEPTLFPKHLPTHIRVELARSSVLSGRRAKAAASQAQEADKPLPPWREFREAGLAELERDYVSRLLSRCGGDSEKARRISALGRTRFFELLKSAKTAPRD